VDKKPIFVTKAFLPPFEEFVEEIKIIWETHILSNNGPIHNEFAEQLKKYLKVDGLALLSNGHQALEIAIKALNLEGEVITTPFTFASTVHAIVRCGLTPVFADIRSDDFNIDEKLIESLITEKTCAILPVHVYGNPCHVNAIEQIAKKHNLKTIYDAAHAFGVEIDSKGIGLFGDISMFSFHATKVFNTIEGGALTFSNPDLDRIIYLLKNFGIAGPEDVLLPGTNAKMSEFQAVMGKINLKYVDAEILKRELVVKKYLENLEDVAGVQIFAGNGLSSKYNYAYLPVSIDEVEYGLSRDSLFELFAREEIFPRKYFFPLVTDYACYRDKFKANIPVARHASERILTLPLWGDISDEAIDRVCKVIRQKS